MLTPPKKGEYSDYFENYIARVRDKDIQMLMISQVKELEHVYNQLTEEKATTPYNERKWTYKELLGHINDTEKIMFFRALCIARGEKESFPGFDQDAYVLKADFNAVTTETLLRDFKHTRELIVSFMNNLPKEAIDDLGVVNGHKTSVSALLHIIPGHFAHHLEIIDDTFQGL